MIRLAEEVAKRGGRPQDPVVYKQQYLDRLMERITDRREGLRSGRIAAGIWSCPIRSSCSTP